MDKCKALVEKGDDFLKQAEPTDVGPIRKVKFLGQAEEW
jgi:hypothetical protein